MTESKRSFEGCKKDAWVEDEKKRESLINAQDDLKKVFDQCTYRCICEGVQRTWIERVQIIQVMWCDVKWCQDGSYDQHLEKALMWFS